MVHNKPDLPKDRKVKQCCGRNRLTRRINVWPIWLTMRIDLNTVFPDPLDRIVTSLQRYHMREMEQLRVEMQRLRGERDKLQGDNVQLRLDNIRLRADLAKAQDMAARVVPGPSLVARATATARAVLGPLIRPPAQRLTLVRPTTCDVPRPEQPRPRPEARPASSTCSSIDWSNVFDRPTPSSSAPVSFKWNCEI